MIGVQYQATEADEVANEMEVCSLELMQEVQRAVIDIGRIDMMPM